MSDFGKDDIIERLNIALDIQSRRRWCVEMASRAGYGAETTVSDARIIEAYILGETL